MKSSFILFLALAGLAASAGDAAVLDKETGLVWELAPSTNQFGWGSSQGICLGSPVGGQG